MNNKINIHFLGDAMTGSKYLVEAMDKMIMIDCGQFSGPEDWSELEWLTPAVHVKDIDLVVLPCTQSKPDDFLSRLSVTGFRGRILSAVSTKNTWHKNIKTGYLDTKQLPDLQNTEQMLNHFKGTSEGIWLNLYPHIRIRFQKNKRLSEYVFFELDVKGERLFLSGETGQQQEPMRTVPVQASLGDLTPFPLYPLQSYNVSHSPRSTPESSFWLG